MSDAETKPRGYLDPIKEAKAVASLRESLRQIGAEDDETLLVDSIEGETSLYEAVDKLLLTIAEAEGLAAGAAAAADEIKFRAERFTKRAEAARAVIEQAMMVAELEKVERPAATLFLARIAPKLELTEEAEIPAEFWKTGEPKLDRKALTAALKEGRAVPGAHLSNCAPSLTVRTK
jgi:hypothetical protein